MILFHTPFTVPVDKFFKISFGVRLFLVRFDIIVRQYTYDYIPWTPGKYKHEYQHEPKRHFSLLAGGDGRRHI